MKIHIVLFLMLLITSTAFSSSTAKEVEVLLIEAEIFKLKKSPAIQGLDAQLEEAILEHSPILIVEIGEDASMEIGFEETTGEAIEMIKLFVRSNKQKDNYNLDFHLTSKGEENISRIADANLNSTLVISASINDIVKVAKIRATKFKNSELAMLALANKKTGI